jgi:transposase
MVTAALVLEGCAIRRLDEGCAEVVTAFWGLSCSEVAMWTPEDRTLVGDYGSGQALSDDQYRLLEPLIPPAKPGGRPRTTNMRRLLDGLFYVVRTGCQWRHLPPPPAFPPWSTVYGYFRAFLAAGVWESMRHHLVVMLREGEGREASPTAAIVDTQSVKTTEKGAHAAGTRRSGSRAASATSQWTRRACCSAWPCTRPTSRTPTALATC